MKPCEPGVIDDKIRICEKWRHILVDEFYGENEGLTRSGKWNSIVRTNELFKKPHFIRKEVTGDIHETLFTKNPLYSAGR